MMGGHKRKDFFFLFVGFEIKKITPVRLKALRELAAFLFFVFFFFIPKRRKITNGRPWNSRSFYAVPNHQPTDRPRIRTSTHPQLRERAPWNTHTHVKGSLLFFVTNCCAREEEEEKNGSWPRQIHFFFQNLAVKSCFFFGTIRKRNNKAKEHTHTHTQIFFKNKRGLTEYFQKISVVNASPGIDPFFFLFLLFQEERERKKVVLLYPIFPTESFFDPLRTAAGVVSTNFPLSTLADCCCNTLCSGRERYIYIYVLYYNMYLSLLGFFVAVVLFGTCGMRVLSPWTIGSAQKGFVSITAMATWERERGGISSIIYPIVSCVYIL